MFFVKVMFVRKFEKFRIYKTRPYVFVKRFEMISTYDIGTRRARSAHCGWKLCVGELVAVWFEDIVLQNE